MQLLNNLDKKKPFSTGNVFFYTIDIFKSPLTLLFNKRRFISTKIGQVLSIVVIIIELIVFMKSDFLNHQAPIIVTSNLRTNNRPFMNLNKKIIAISLKNEETMQNFLDFTVFSIEIANVFYQMNENRTAFDQIKSIKKKTRICSADNLSEYESEFQGLFLGSGLCLDSDDNNFELEGFRDEMTLSYLEIKLKMCINESITNNSCKTPEEIERLLTGKSFNIYYKDIFVDFHDYETPFKSAIVNDHRYIDVKFTKNVDFFFQRVTLTHDEGVFFPQTQTFSEIGFSSKNQDFYTRNENESTLLSINIYSDNKIQNTQRVYMRLQDLLAKMGGIMQSLLVLGSFLVNFEYSLLLKNTMLNALYSFKKPKKKYPKNDFMGSSQIMINNLKNITKTLVNRFASFFNIKARIKPKENFKETQMVSVTPPKSTLKFNREVLKRITITPNYIYHFEQKPSNNENFQNFSNNLQNKPSVMESNSAESCHLTPYKAREPMNFSLGLQKLQLEEENTTNNNNNLSLGLNNLATPDQEKNENFIIPKQKILKFQTFKQSSKILYFTLMKYIKYGLKQMFPFCQMNYEERLFLKSEKIYEKDLDFIEILKKLQDIDKLKKILLNTNQELLFNFLMKPLVYLDVSNPHTLRKARQKYTIHLGSKVLQREGEELRNAIDEFEKLADQGLLSEVDKRIMNIIDRESSKFVKIAEDLSPRGKGELTKFF